MSSSALAACVRHLRDRLAVQRDHHESDEQFLRLGKAKLSMLLLTVSLLGGGVLVPFQRAAAENGAPPAAEKAKP